MKNKSYRIEISRCMEKEIELLALETFPKSGGQGNKKRTIEALVIHGLKTMTPNVLRDVYFDYQKELAK